MISFMRKLPLILTVLLIWLWAYTCWYWYTCNIQWFCDEGSKPAVQGENLAVEIAKMNQGEDRGIISGQDASGGVVTDREGSPKLSAQDVLFDPLPKEVEAIVTTEISQSGSLNSSETRPEAEIEETQEATQETNNTESATICESPLIGPVVFWGDNTQAEVEKLEIFLISRGESVAIDGIYGEDDVQAIKRFQLEYKQDVLDPWGITAPTGYVGRTSIAKINELACK